MDQAPTQDEEHKDTASSGSQKAKIVTLSFLASILVGGLIVALVVFFSRRGSIQKINSRTSKLISNLTEDPASEVKSLVTLTLKVLNAVDSAEKSTSSVDLSKFTEQEKSNIVFDPILKLLSSKEEAIINKHLDEYCIHVIKVLNAVVSLSIRFVKKRNASLTRNESTDDYFLLGKVIFDKIENFLLFFNKFTKDKSYTQDTKEKKNYFVQLFLQIKDYGGSTRSIVDLGKYFEEKKDKKQTNVQLLKNPLANFIEITKALDIINAMDINLQEITNMFKKVQKSNYQLSMDESKKRYIPLLKVFCDRIVTFKRMYNAYSESKTDLIQKLCKDKVLEEFLKLLESLENFEHSIAEFKNDHGARFEEILESVAEIGII